MAMDSQLSYATKEDLWTLQETLSEISATQARQTEQIMRLEKRRDDDGRVKNVWGPSSPFTSMLGSSNNESNLNPTAEAFRNFDAENPAGMISALSLDPQEESRRAAASRANSVRFDESANNHYGASSRQSIDLPTRTGSGLGSHPLSERSLSHRSDGRGSNAGFGQRTNSFGFESSRLLGSVHNSPRVSGNPAPGFFILGPFPSIIRCWLTETFSKDSLLYAAVCTGSYGSCITISLIQRLGLSDQTFEENGLRKIKLSVYLTEAKIQQLASRSSSPTTTPQVPTMLVKFAIAEPALYDRTIQVTIGSDVLRAHNADILLSQDKLMIFDDDRNQLSVPLVRPEDESVYKNLTTTAGAYRGTVDSEATARPSSSGEPLPPGIIGRPSRLITDPGSSSPVLVSSSVLTSAAPSDIGDSRKSEPISEGTARSITEQAQLNDDSKSTTGSEKSFPTPLSNSSSGVWANSWRAGSGQAQAESPATTKTASSYSRISSSRPMKVLRPSKPMSSTSRSTSMTQPNGSESAALTERKPIQTNIGDSKAASAPTKSNPVGSASAFGWLNSGQQKRSVANGGE